MTPTMMTDAWRGVPNRGCYEHVHDLPPPSVSTALLSDPRRAAMDSYGGLGGGGKSIADGEPRLTHELPPLTDPYTGAAAYHSRLCEPPTPPTDRAPGPQKPPTVPRNVSSSAVLRYEPGADAHERLNANAPLTLQIPKDPELPRINTVFGAPPSSQYHNRGIAAYSQPSTTLPSFAAFQEHANRANGQATPEAPPTLARNACMLCSKLQPMVKEVANAVAELDENLQSVCNKAWSRSLEYPKDNPLQLVQWILDRLRYGKADLQAAARSAQSAGYRPTPPSVSGAASRNISPTNPLKRPADSFDHHDSPNQKRINVGGSPDTLSRTTTISNNDRRASFQYTAGQTYPSGISPPPTESVPGSAYPKGQSPGLPGRTGRPLPSPSSVAFPPSAPPSLAPQTARSVGSPTASQTAEASTHTASTDAATAAHIADLQHQVTLKSLALQTLQTEYASLLQKLQRLNVKTQTMERKSNVADQEVNELTNRNEDLSQQVQSLQEQLDDSEKRREKDREEASREKDQWLQMLEQGRRLQARVEQDRRTLAQRVATLQTEYDELRRDIVFDDAISDGDDSAPGARLKKGLVRARSDDVAALNANLKTLRTVLEEAKRHRQQLDERAHDVLRQSTDLNNAIDRALQATQFEDHRKTPEPVLDAPNSDINPKPQNKAVSPAEGPRVDHATLTASQPSPLFPTDPLPADERTISPKWRPIQPTEESLQLGSFRPMTYMQSPQETGSAQSPRSPEYAVYSPSGSATSFPDIPTSNTPSLVRKPSLEIAGLGNETKSPNQLDLLAAAETIPTPVTPGSVQQQHAYEWDPTASPTSPKYVASSTTMPPPPRPLS